MQMTGKLALVLTPMVNHWWNIAFQLTARGLSTYPMAAGSRILQLEFDFPRHQLVFQFNTRPFAAIGPWSRSVAQFFAPFQRTLHASGVAVDISPMPVEIPDPVRFDRDSTHATYDPAAVARLWRILLSVDTVLREFRARFIGKCSPVHFFWGSFDLCVTRF